MQTVGMLSDKKTVDGLIKPGAIYRKHGVHNKIYRMIVNIINEIVIYIALVFTSLPIF